MKIGNYLKDKYFELIILFLGLLLIVGLLMFLELSILVIVFIPLVYVISIFICFIYDYLRRKKFYKEFSNNLTNLDKKYYITEMIDNNYFLDASLFLDYLYEIDKSYIEKLNSYKYNAKELKEYIELWCHEIKTPIATSKLIINNNSNKITNSIEEEMDSIEEYVEQVLYYARSEAVYKDYLITKINLKDIINEVLKKNKKMLLAKKIKIELSSLDVIVESDMKWLVFIINQIITNSIKYSKNNNSVISIIGKENKNNVILTIKDNGIGIKEEEIGKVFDKAFTGTNGRINHKSTGIGLYLCKKLCLKLGHNISIRSILNKETNVTIVFPNSSLINECKQ